MVKGYRLNWFISGFDKEFNKAITKFMIEAACICSSETCRAVVTNIAETFALDFTLGEQKIANEAIDAKEEKLKVTFYEVRMTGLNGAPQLEGHAFEVAFVAVDEEGVNNVAVENSMYRTFAAKFFQMLDLFPDRFIKDSYYIGDEKILS